jgi:hypothetical protein
MAVFTSTRVFVATFANEESALAFQATRSIDAVQLRATGCSIALLQTDFTAHFRSVNGSSSNRDRSDHNLNTRSSIAAAINEESLLVIG